MQKKRALILLILPFIFGTSFITYAQQAKIPLEFYYGDGCPHCARISPLLDQLGEKYPFLSVEKIETYHNNDNAQRLMEVFTTFNIPHSERGVPTVVFNHQIFIGGNMMNDLEQAVINVGNGRATTNETVPGKTETPPTSFWAYLLAILGPAFVDSVNPCAIAVLVILLGALMLQNDKKRALWGALAFTFSIYISYFLFGLGLTHVIKVSGASLWIYKIIGILAIILGLANLKDAFWYGKGGFVMEIPRSWRPALKKMLHAITSPLGAFLIGFVVTLFELPCTGGPYFFVIGLMADKIDYTMIIPLLLLYNIVFVLPLLIVTFVIYTGISTAQKTEAWKDKNIKQLHLIGGIIMLLLGIWVLYN